MKTQQASRHDTEMGIQAAGGCPPTQPHLHGSGAIPMQGSRPGRPLFPAMIRRLGTCLPLLALLLSTQPGFCQISGVSVYPNSATTAYPIDVYFFVSGGDSNNPTSDISRLFGGPGAPYPAPVQVLFGSMPALVPSLQIYNGEYFTLPGSYIVTELSGQTIAVVPVTLQNTTSGFQTAPAYFTIFGTDPSQFATASVNPGGTTTVTPSSPNLDGSSVSATLTLGSSDPQAVVTVAQYSSPPVSGPSLFTVGSPASYFDVQVMGATCGDSLVVTFHSTPGSLLYYWDPTANTGSGAFAPVIDSTCCWGTDLTSTFPTPGQPVADGSGYTTVHFDCTSTPKINQLTGTIFLAGHLKTPTEQLTDLAAAVQALDTQAGLKNALGAKVQAVQADVADQDVTSACNVLGAFLNQVSAQTGKKLTATQASQLTNWANAIRTTLGC